jgi:hypothetical protein
VLILAIVATTLACQSCNIGAPLYYILHGPQRTPALYELQDKPTVVFVDDRNNAIPERADVLRRDIADLVSVELMKKKILTNTIRPADAMKVARQNDRYNSVMSIGDIAAAVGAEQIIYVEMLVFRTSEDGYSPRPVSAANVKVLDVASQMQVFPAATSDAESDGHLVQVVMSPISGEYYSQGREMFPIYEMLAEEVGTKIAKVFYEHETVELGGQLDPR